MTLETTDLAILGAGPAGMAAATTAAALGLRVTLLDEQEAVGGQIYRSITSVDSRRLEILGPDYAAGAALARAFAASGARHESGAAVWDVNHDGVIHYLQQGRSRSLPAQRLLLCPGAMERPFPIPGWTLPGVMTVGAAQILLKSAQAVPREPVILVGCGPLLYLLGWQYVRAGVPLRAVVDTAEPANRRAALAHLPGALAAWPMLRKGLALIRALRKAGVPFYHGASELAIEGEQAATALRFRSKGREHRLETRLVLLHQGVVPNTQLSWALRAAHHWDASQLCWIPETDAWGELDVPGVFVAGDGAGIAGAQAAAEQGRIAALAIACALNKIDAGRRDHLAAPVRRALRGALRIRPFLETLYRPPLAQRVPADDVIVCRCEEVTARTLRDAVALGCTGPNQAKAFSRCGMGPCQGRQCGLTVTEVIADARGVAPAEVGYYRLRSPIKPITLGELAVSESSVT
jgi:NADPH-dependent 2,4-dienoyl-CoA reductase/sulfur reductase-like enzyme